MATGGSDNNYIAVPSTGLQTYQFEPQQAFLVVGNVPASSRPASTCFTHPGYSVTPSNVTKTQINTHPNLYRRKCATFHSSKEEKSVVTRKRACNNRPTSSNVHCSECGEIFQSPDNLAQHLTSQHKNSVKYFKCLYCPQIFFSRNLVLAHIKSVLSSKKPTPTHVAGMLLCVKHTCPVCAQVHVSAQRLKVHLHKSSCGDIASEETPEALLKDKKIACMKAVLQSYKPSKISASAKVNECSETCSENSKDESGIKPKYPATRDSNASSSETNSNTNHQIAASTESTNMRFQDQPHCTMSQAELRKPCPLPPAPAPHFYPQPPTTYIRAPVVMAVPINPGQYYNLDYYQYPHVTHQMTPHQYTYQPRLACPVEANPVNKQLFSCLHCGLKFSEFDLLARHFRDNSCNSTAVNSLEGIVNCNSESQY